MPPTFCDMKGATGSEPLTHDGINVMNRLDVARHGPNVTYFPSSYAHLLAIDFYVRLQVLVYSNSRTYSVAFTEIRWKIPC